MIRGTVKCFGAIQQVCYFVCGQALEAQKMFVPPLCSRTGSPARTWEGRSGFETVSEDCVIVVVNR